MQDIFISPLDNALVSWVEAFPKAKTFVTVNPQPNKAEKEAKIVFWLHMNQDRQQWMVNTVALIQQKYPNAMIAVLANAPVQAEALHVLSLGVLAYAHAYISAKILGEIKTVIANGGVWLGQELLQRLIEVSISLAGTQAQQVEKYLKVLTKREKEVAVQAAKGLSNKEIARILKITERTVKAHLASIFELLKVKDRLHLALMLNRNYQI